MRFCFVLFLIFVHSLLLADQGTGESPSEANIPSETPTIPHKSNQEVLSKQLNSKGSDSPSHISPEQNPKLTEEQNKNSSDSDSSSSFLNHYFQQNQSQSNTPNSPSTPYTSNLPSAWGPFFFLLVVVLLLYILIKWIKKRVQRIRTIENPVDFIRVVFTLPLVSQTQLVLLDIGGKYSLLSVSPHSSSIIMEITDPELVLKIQSIPPGGSPRRFSEVVSELLGIRAKKTLSPKKSEEKLKRFIESQKDRMEKM